MSNPGGGRSLAADFGLTALVLGGGAAFLLGLIAVGAGALLGRIPLFLGVLLALASLTALSGLAATVTTARSQPKTPGADEAPQGREADAGEAQQLPPQTRPPTKPPRPR